MDFDRFWHKTLGRPYRLHTEPHGNPANPTIVLLHGIAASSEDFGKLIPLLTPYYYCVTIDLLGFAKSPKPQWANYTMEQHVSSIAYTINKLRLSRTFILAGHSLGSFLATRYARQHSPRVSRLLLLSPPVYPPLSDITAKVALRRTDALMRLYKFLRTHPRMTPENMRRLSYIAPLPRSITTHPQTWLPFHRSLEHCIEQQTITADITAIKAPVDVFYGSLDAVVVPHNVKSLAKLTDVRLHTFRGKHSIGSTYVTAIAIALKQDMQQQ